MTAIERTAYPRLTTNPSARELEDNYTPTPEELAFVNVPGRGPGSRLTVLTLLKIFQCLGYFPALEDIPERIINHMRQALDMLPDVTLNFDTPTSLYRHHHAIRDYLDITPYRAGGEDVAGQALYQAAEAKSDPADLINAAIEELVRHRYELPAFSTLNTLTKRIRREVNDCSFAFFAVVLKI